jgi:hypothetical protein
MSAMGWSSFSRLVANLRLVRSAFTPSEQRTDQGGVLTCAIAAGIREILPSDEFELQATDMTISIKGIGRCSGYSYSTAPFLLWNLALPASARLEQIFEIQSRGLQEFITKARHEPWPAKGAKAHVRVTPEEVVVWWGGPREADAHVTLRPISREKLGL